MPTWEEGRLLILVRPKLSLARGGACRDRTDGGDRRTPGPDRTPLYACDATVVMLV